MGERLGTRTPERGISQTHHIFHTPRWLVAGEGYNLILPNSSLILGVVTFSPAHEIQERHYDFRRTPKEKDISLVIAGTFQKGHAQYVRDPRNEICATISHTVPPEISIHSLPVSYKEGHIELPASKELVPFHFFSSEVTNRLLVDKLIQENHPVD